LTARLWLRGRLDFLALYLGFDHIQDFEPVWVFVTGAPPFFDLDWRFKRDRGSV
jgi:hypothetical protein